MKTYYKDEKGELRYLNTLVSSIDEDNEYWGSFKNRMGFNPSNNPLPITIDAPIETTHQYVVRGGRGRWNNLDFPDAAFTNGSHLFEGWDTQESYRLSMLIGKYKEGTANIFTFKPSHTGVETFGVVNLGCDKNYKGTDFSKEYMLCHGQIKIPHYGMICGNITYLPWEMWGGVGANSGVNIKMYPTNCTDNPAGMDIIIGAGSHRIMNQDGTVIGKTNNNGFVVINLDKDPSVLENGQIWYNTTENKFKGVVNGIVKSFLME